MSEKYQAPTTRRYPAEFKERAVRMVRQLREETGEKSTRTLPYHHIRTSNNVGVPGGAGDSAVG